MPPFRKAPPRLSQQGAARRARPQHRDASLIGAASSARANAIELAKLIEDNDRSANGILEKLWPEDDNKESNFFMQIMLQEHFAQHYPRQATSHQVAIHLATETVVRHRLGLPASIEELLRHFKVGERPLAVCLSQGNRVTVDEAIRSAVVNFASPLSEHVLAEGQYFASPARYLAVKYLTAYGFEPSQLMTPLHRERIIYVEGSSLGLIALNRKPILRISELLLSRTKKNVVQTIQSLLDDNLHMDEASDLFLDEIQRIVRNIMVDQPTYSKILLRGRIN